MKKYLIYTILCSCLTLSLTACGGGGGGGSAPPPVPTTKVVLSAYLFGTMSSSTATIGAIDASMTVPSGVLVNYSSPAPSGFPANVYPLRSGSMIPSGALLNSSAMTTGSYNTQTGKIQLSIILNNAVTPLRSSSVDNGTEFAKLYFKLITADSNIPFQPSGLDLKSDIKQTDLSIFSSDVPARGCELKFSSTYQ